MEIISHNKRLSAFKYFAGVCIFFNFLQLLIGFLREANTAETIVNAVSGENYFSNLIYQRFCFSQADNLMEICTKSELTKTIVVGIFPMFFAETAVMIIVLLFTASILFFTRHSTVESKDLYWGIGFATILFLFDQARYIYTSILNVNKKLFTWSSYCIQGDIGWLFDALGYAALYGAVAISISSFVASYRELTPTNLSIKQDHFGKKSAFTSVESTFSWLAYFGYSFLIIWVVFTGITPNASLAYAMQGAFIFILIFGFYFAVIFQYIRISLWHQSYEGKNSASNPIETYLAPHGTKAVQTLIKLALPILFFLSIWFEWIAKISTIAI